MATTNKDTISRALLLRPRGDLGHLHPTIISRQDRCVPGGFAIFPAGRDAFDRRIAVGMNEKGDRQALGLSAHRCRRIDDTVLIGRPAVIGPHHHQIADIDRERSGQREDVEPLLPLAVFKYTAFAVGNAAAAMGWTAPAGFDWALPLGISFVTFTAVAYVLDVRGGRVMARSRIADTGLYIAFFPQLIAGPILRPSELIPQLPRIAFRRSMVAYAALLFTLGAVKKVVVADGIGPHVDAIYTMAGPISQPQALFALYGFTVQIYCDFSAYTDMALALAALLGVRLPRNFNRPYLAASVREFWRCWHMTLSRWLRDYLYFSLGGNRQGTVRMLAAVMATMLLGGLWHGAAWTFVLWGGAHGLYIIVENGWARMAQGRRFPLPTWARRLVVLHLVAVAWVLFRAPGLDQVVMVYSGILVPGGTGINTYAGFAAGALWPLLLMAAFFLLHQFDTVARVRWVAAKLPAEVTVAGAFSVLAVCVALSVDNPNSFIYFDF